MSKAVRDSRAFMLKDKLLLQLIYNSIYNSYVNRHFSKNLHMYLINLDLKATLFYDTI